MWQIRLKNMLIQQKRQKHSIFSHFENNSTFDVYTCAARHA
jgi:hypothetical protein